MNIVIKKAASNGGLGQSPKIGRPSPYDKRHGAWGRVEKAHSDDNTADIFLDTGVHLKRVPVASREWVVSGVEAEKDYNTGERDLPPSGARVFVMLPTGGYDDCFILCYGFSAIDQTPPFMADDKENTRERITPSGWHITDDHATGSHEAVSPDGKTRLEIDYAADAPALRLALFDSVAVEVAGGGATARIFDTEIEIKEGSPILIKNAAGSLGGFVKELLEALAALHTEGSAAMVAESVSAAPGVYTDQERAVFTAPATALSAFASNRRLHKKAYFLEFLGEDGATVEDYGLWAPGILWTSGFPIGIFFLTAPAETAPGRRV